MFVLLKCLVTLNGFSFQWDHKLEPLDTGAYSLQSLNAIVYIYMYICFEIWASCFTCFRVGGWPNALLRKFLPSLRNLHFPNSCYLVHIFVWCISNLTFLFERFCFATSLDVFCRATMDAAPRLSAFPRHWGGAGGHVDRFCIGVCCDAGPLKFLPKRWSQEPC